MATPQRGGYDYQFVDTPLDMFLCKICHFPSKEPHLSTCCGHTFCKSCLDGTIRSPFKPAITVCPMCRSNGLRTFLNKQNERAINSLHVFCTNKDKGCDWQGELNNISGHLRNSDGCQFEEVKCSNDCGLLLQRQHLPSHVDNECPCREVHCQYCSVVGQHQFIMGPHVEECPKVPLPCPNSCGVDSILREDMEFHKTTCPLEDVECPNDCGEVLQRQSMTNHIEVECSRRKVICQYCQFSEEYQVIEGQHKEECPKFPMNCPNDCEIGSIPREDIVTHRLKCPLEVIECTYYSIGCRNTMARKDWYKHEKEKMEEHLHLTSNKLTEYQTKIDELESEVKQNKALLELLFGEWAMELNIKALQSSTGDQMLPVVLRMPDYASNKNWYSNPFYTHEKGYKMKLRVDCRKYLSVHLCLMQGPYDNELSWPLTGRFKITLLDQTKSRSFGQRSRTANVYNATVLVTDKDTSGKDIANDSIKEVWDDLQFIITPLPSQYLKNDSLFFEVSKVPEINFKKNLNVIT